MCCFGKSSVLSVTNMREQTFISLHTFILMVSFERVFYIAVIESLYMAQKH